MIITTTPDIAGRRIIKTIGLVRGSAVRGMNIGKDLLAFFRNTVGGEIDEYTKMLAETREQALDRMIHDARTVGANAVVGVRYASSEIASGAAEILVYGTAVIIDNNYEPSEQAASSVPGA